MTRSVDAMRASLGMSKDPATVADEEAAGIVDDFDKESREPAKLVIVERKTNLDPEVLKTDIADDYVHARNLTYTLIEGVGDALAGALTVAKESEHPRAYQVVKDLADTMRGLTQDLLAMQKIFKEIKRDDPTFIPPAPAAPAVGTQNNFFTSTTQVVKMIEEARKQQEAGQGDVPVIEDVTTKPAPAEANG